jgi:ABC-2 type transport system permease protein
MRGLLFTYRRLIAASWAQAVEYRAQFILWILTFFFPLIMMAVWLAVVREAGPVAGWDAPDFISYYVAAAVVSHLTTAWILWDWDDDIRTGTMSMRLAKPLDPLHHYIAGQFGWKIFVLLLLVPPVAAAAWLLPQIDYPLTPARVAAFVFALILGLAVSIAESAAFAMIAFWSTQARNVYSLWVGVGQFLSGWIIPLALLPPVMRGIAVWLPFRATLGLPVEILMGSLSAGETLFGFVVTMGWIVGLVLVYRLLWVRGVRQYEAVGG